MKQILPLFAIFACLSGPLVAQSADHDKETKKYGITFKGFIKSDYWYDTRQVVASREELFLLFPKNVLLGPDGKDVNGEDYVNFSPVASRLTGIITGPDAFGAKTSGVLEADFSGVTNADINGLRLRHAYGKLRWDATELLFGQFWHPLFVTEVFPNVISLNTGPLFSLLPEIRRSALPGISTVGTYKCHSCRNGIMRVKAPQGVNGVYMRNALVPNLHLQLQYKSLHHVAGLAADWKSLRPKLADGLGNITDSKISSYASMVYWKYNSGDFTWRSKAIYGQNLTEHLLLGGYAVKHFDSLTHKETYTPTNNMFLWGNITYGKKIMYGLFGGYAKNFGTSDVNTGRYYSRGSDIAYMYRIAPSVSFLSNTFQVSFEPEYTVAAYGTPDNKGKVLDYKEVGSLRLLLTLFYYF